MFATIFAIYLLLTFIIFSLIFYPTQAFDVTNVLPVSVYGAVDESSKSGKIGEDSAIVDCKEEYQQEGNRCILRNPSYYCNSKQECSDTWAGGNKENAEDHTLENSTSNTNARLSTCHPSSQSCTPSDIILDNSGAVLCDPRQEDCVAYLGQSCDFRNGKGCVPGAQECNPNNSTCSPTQGDDFNTDVIPGGVFEIPKANDTLIEDNSSR